MTVTLRLFLLSSLALVVLCEQPQQQQDVPLTLAAGWIPKVRRTFRTMSPVPVVGNLPVFGNPAPLMNTVGMPEYTFQLRPRAPRLSYQLPYYTSNPTVSRSYRRLRTSLPSAFSMDSVSGDEEGSNLQQASAEQLGKLRFLGWLFGRPSISPYQDYSILEEAAGISPYGSRYPYTRPYSPAVVVEECVTLEDPLTHHVFEECQDVPAYH